MNRLILVRHGKTERRAPSGDDFDRRLTDRGRSDAALMAGVLAEAGYAPDLVLLSPAARARETWDLFAPRFPSATVIEKAALYSAGPAEILRLAGARAEDCVMVVAHNPSLHMLAVDLTEGAGAAVGNGVSRQPLSEGFPTSSVAVVDLGGEHATLGALLLPRDHGGGGDD